MTGVASETVKSITSALALPTVSASFGQEGDLRQWRDINEQKSNYLLQVSYENQVHFDSNFTSHHHFLI